MISSFTVQLKLSDSYELEQGNYISNLNSFSKTGSGRQVIFTNGHYIQKKSSKDYSYGKNCSF